MARFARLQVAPLAAVLTFSAVTLSPAMADDNATGTKGDGSKRYCLRTIRCRFERRRGNPDKSGLLKPSATASFAS